MRKRIARYLRAAERSQAWTSNSQEAWEPIVSELAARLESPVGDIHAAKIQTRSARKSLWQGRLHRDPPLKVLFLAADSPCDDRAFETLSRSVEERFMPPAVWADACFVLSEGRLLGYLEREGVGLTAWLSSAERAVLCAECEPVSDQWNLQSRLNPAVSDPDRFVTLLERALPRGKEVEFLCSAFGVTKDVVLRSVTGVSANAAKGRWEGADVDPSRRFRIALVGASEWSWSNAALELSRRMSPSDLSLETAVLFSKESEGGNWVRARAFVSSRSPRREDLRLRLEEGGIDDVRIIEDMPQEQDYAEEVARLNSLRVRDSDVGEIRYEVTRPKRRIHDLITNWLREWAQQQDLSIFEGSDPIALYDALVMREEEPHLLIEVKSSAEPGVVRLAVGQLVDYGRVLRKSGVDVEGVLLIPETERLTEELRDLLRVVNVSWAVLQFSERGGDQITLQIHRPDGAIEAIP